MENTQTKDNEYALLNFKRVPETPNDTEGTQTFQTVAFYKMNADGSFENGTTLEEMLRVCSERLTMFQETFPCNENAQALNGIANAISALNDRTEDRKNRGVEGKHEA